MNTVTQWLSKRFNDPQIIALTGVIVVLGLVILNFGDILAPVFTAVVVAYLLEGTIRFLNRVGFPRPVAFIAVFTVFMMLILLLVTVALPAIGLQITKLLDALPKITGLMKDLAYKLSDQAEGLVNPAFAENLLGGLVGAAEGFLADLVPFLLSGLPGGVFNMVLYLFLVPFLVFFFLKDKEKLVASFKRLLPKDRALLYNVLRESDAGIGAYIRGKFWEFVIFGISSYLMFALLGSNWSFLLALLSGFSVLIPYLGVVVLAVPVTILSIFQWGLTWETGQILIAFAVINIVDGNIIAPLILGEAVDVHPTLIVTAVLIFGSLWGIWGVFFAVPLAVLVKSIYFAIPSAHDASSA